MGMIAAICTSPAKGTQKTAVAEAVLVVDHGIEGDAHAGNWHRQVSLLSIDEVEDFEKNLDFKLAHGAFGENLLVRGLPDLATLPIGTRLKTGSVVLEVTQIGKACHHGCAIREKVGDCIMPRKGIFARVLTGGLVKAGDPITIQGQAPYRLGILTASDKGAAGDREDVSGQVIADRLARGAGFDLVSRDILPDDKAGLEAYMRDLAEGGRVDLLLTTGGTGLSPRDQMPEATLAVCDRLVPGIPEALRAASLAITGRAMLSRAQAGVAKKMLIVNLPGSPKAVGEHLEVLVPQLDHALEILTGRGGECGQEG